MKQGKQDHSSTPFFRDCEKGFSQPGGIKSPVGSVHNFTASRGNVMEQELGGLENAGRGTTFGGGKKGRK